MKMIVASLIFFGIILVAGYDVFAQTADEKAYMDSLIDGALTQELHQKRYWHLLLHYTKNLLGTYESEEDGPEFFNTPSGKTNPKAELLATIKKFFQDPSLLESGKEHPQCIFPARFKWLDSILHFKPEILLKQTCERLDGWLQELSPQKITLVFSSFYLNNPASMFGHTLLRIDKNRETSDQKLLNYGINYAANTDTSTNGFLFAFKGLFGFFKGTFTIFPYYTKVQKYSNLESRDLWEYELNFSDEQMDYLLRHLWELGGK